MTKIVKSEIYCDFTGKVETYERTEIETQKSGWGGHAYKIPLPTSCSKIECRT